jgi:hypothetical protein
VASLRNDGLRSSKQDSRRLRVTAPHGVPSMATSNMPCVSGAQGCGPGRSVYSGGLYLLRLGERVAIIQWLDLTVRANVCTIGDQPGELAELAVYRFADQ